MRSYAFFHIKNVTKEEVTPTLFTKMLHDLPNFKK